MWSKLRGPSARACFALGITAILVLGAAKVAIAFGDCSSGEPDLERALKPGGEGRSGHLPPQRPRSKSTKQNKWNSGCAPIVPYARWSNLTARITRKAVVPGFATRPSNFRPTCRSK